MSSTSNILLFLALAVSCMPTAAFAETAEEMNSACRAFTQAKVSFGEVRFTENYDTGLCWGAFGVLHQTIEILDVSTHRPAFFVCGPTNSTRTQLVTIFVEYLKRNPQMLSEDFTAVALRSLRVAFPCGK
jgi:Rap1a immunity proteins